MGKLTDHEAQILRSLPVTVYSPGVAAIMKYGPLGSKGLLNNEDIGSDEAQETIWRIFITDAGRQALSEGEQP